MKDMVLVEVIPRTILNINHMPTTGNDFKNNQFFHIKIHVVMIKYK